MSDLIVETQQLPHRTVITVAGDIDARTCPELAQATAELPSTIQTLHMDLSGVRFMDSSGLNLLLQLRQHLEADGGHLAVTGLQDQAARLLEVTQTYELLTADPDGAKRPPPEQPRRHGSGKEAYG
jgi:anti-sigma B factor antagonist